MNAATEVKHTPGPWRWLGPSLIGDHGKRPAILVSGKGGINTRGEDGLLRLIEGDEANARLIAAAPEMLEAAKALLNAPYGTVGDCDEWDAAMHGLEAAITKAEGSAN